MDKVVPQLLNQIQAVTYEHKARIFYALIRDNTLDHHDHGEGFAAALRVPDYTAAACTIILSVDAAHDVFHTEVLLISGHLFHAAVIEDIEAHEVEKSLLGKQRNDDPILFRDMSIIHIPLCGILLPLDILFMPSAIKLLPGSGGSVFYRLRVHGDDELGELEQLRNVIRLPVADILFYALLHVHAGLFALNHDHGNPINQYDDVRSGEFAVVPLYRKLIRDLPYVVLRVFPVDIGNIERLGIAVIQVNIAALAIDQAIIDCLAGKHQPALQWRIQFPNRVANGLIGKRRLPAAIHKGL